MRVFDLAKKHGTPSKAVLEILTTLGFAAKNHMSVLTEKAVTRVTEELARRKRVPPTTETIEKKTRVLIKKPKSAPVEVLTEPVEIPPAQPAPQASTSAPAVSATVPPEKLRPAESAPQGQAPAPSAVGPGISPPPQAPPPGSRITPLRPLGAAERLADRAGHPAAGPGHIVSSPTPPRPAAPAGGTWTRPAAPAIPDRKSVV